MKAISQGRRSARVVRLVFILAAGAGMVSRLSAQNASAADVAARMSGRWRLNTELTPTSKPGRGRGPAAFAMAGAVLQRGGRGGGGSGSGGSGGSDASSPLMAEEVAAQAALS